MPGIRIAHCLCPDDEGPRLSMELVLDDEEIGAVHETPPYVHRQRSERVKKNSKCLAAPLKRLNRVFFSVQRRLLVAYAMEQPTRKLLMETAQ